jgi:uncharacterized membrane protein YeiB
MTFLKKDYLFIPIVIVILAIALLLVAPDEATIGRGIRIVYIHVALIWTGMLGLLVTGALGLILLLFSRDDIQSWMTVVGRVSLVVYAAGVGTSLIAEQVNWGGIAWQEPRTSANLNLLALVVIVQVVNSWLEHRRLGAILNILVATAVIYMSVTTPLQLHPSDPIRTSSSSEIQLAFYGLTLLCLAGAGWLVWFVHKKRKNPS